MDQYQHPVVAEFTSNNLNLLPPETGVSGENEALSPVSSEDSKTIKEISRLSQSLSLDQEEFDPQTVEASYEDDKSTGVFTESSSPDTNQTLIDWQNFHIAHEENNEMENQQKSSGRSRPNSLSLPDLQEQNESTSSRQSNNAHAIPKIEKIKLSNSRGRTQSDVIVIPPTRKVLEDLEAQESLSKSLPQGTILRKGDMIEFIADDLQEKIRRSSPMSKTGSSNSRRSSVRSTASYSSNASAGTSMATSTASGWSRSPSSLFQQSPDDIPPIDPHAIMELENQARKVADDIDHMLGNLRSSLHKMSARSAACLLAYKDSVDLTCDSVDTSIKSMYALMAKCEELNKTVEPVYQIANEIKEIKRLLDLFESQLIEKGAKSS